MSRFSDCDDYDEDYPNQYALYQANTDRALKGKRGKAFLLELEAALLALPEKKLIEGRICEAGQVCAMGALALKRRMSTGEKIEDALRWLEDESPQEAYAYETADFMEKHFGILSNLAIRVAHVNDEWARGTPEGRYETVLKWVREELVKS